jgi:hypothetical protein
MRPHYQVLERISGRRLDRTALIQSIGFAHFVGSGMLATTAERRHDQIPD